MNEFWEGRLYLDDTLQVTAEANEDVTAQIWPSIVILGVAKLR